MACLVGLVETTYSLSNGTTLYEWGTGTVIGSHTILTASHMFWNSQYQLKATDFYFFPGYSSTSYPYGGTGSTVNDTGWHAHFFDVGDVGADTISPSDSQFDYAVVDVSYDFTNYGSFGIITNNGGGTGHLTGYPDTSNGAQNDQTGTYSPVSGYSLYQYGSLTSHPGNSGGPLWVTGSDGLPYVVGVASSTSYANELTTDKFNQIVSWVQGDGYSLSGGGGGGGGGGGVDLTSTLVDVNTFTGLGGHSTTTNVGGQIVIQYKINNSGSTQTGAGHIGFYASTDQYIGTNDIQIPGTGQYTILTDYVPANGSTPVETVTLTLPTSVTGSATGTTWYIGLDVNYDEGVTETNYNNGSSTTIPITVYSNGNGGGNGPDLVVTSFQLNTTNWVVGQTITATYSVKNQGNATATQDGNIINYLILSTDSNISVTGGDPSLALDSSGPFNSNGEPTLAPGASFTGTINYTVTANSFAHGAGTYYVGVLADGWPNGTGSLTETNENNNYSSPIQINVSIPSQPDFVADHVALSSSTVAAGGGLTVFWRLSNIGNGSAAPGNARIYLSTDSTITTSDTALATVNYPSSIAANAFIDSSQAITLPGNLSGGTYYIGVIADADNQVTESNENNNASTGISFTVPTPLPDFGVDHLALSSTSFAAGSNVTVYWRLYNIGNAAAAPANARIYLSTDNVITTSDTALSTVNYPSSLAANTYIDSSQAVTIPGNLAPGTYYIGVISDADNQVTESNENNNASIGTAFTVPTPLPDFVADHVALSSNSVFAGGGVTVFWRTANIGNTGAAPGNVRVYLSTDNVITTADTLLTTVSMPSSLGASAYVDSSHAVTLPANLSGGTYYIGVIVDADNQVTESNENNNASAPAALTVPSLPDFVADHVALSSNSVFAGGGVTVFWRTANIGNTGAAPGNVRVYLSTDNVITTSDTLLSTVSLSSLAANTFVDSSQAVTLPANLVGGTYYVGVIADANNQVTESNESNNASPAATLTVPSLPDFVADHVALNNSTVLAGGGVTVYWRTANIGNTGAAPGNVRIYLSTDNVITTSDTALSTIALSSSLAANTFVDSSQAVTIPGNLAPGTYYVGVIPDFGNQVTESNETNNASVPATLTIPSLPDFVADHVALSSSSVVAGSGVTVYWRTANIGTLSGAPGNARIYLSTDNVITTSDTVLGTVAFSSSLAANAYVDSSQAVTIPGNLGPGTYYVGVIPDFGNQVTESNETNNASPAATLTIPNNPDFVADHLALSSSSVGAGSSVMVYWRIANIGTLPAAPVNARIYLSTDNVITTSDTVLGTVAFSSSLAANTYVDSSQAIALPQNLLSGTYYIGVIPDSDNQVVELSESNNASTGIAIGITADDFAGSTATTGQLASGGIAVGRLEIAGDHDWFRVALAAGTTYVINEIGASGGGGTLPDPSLHLYNSASQLVAFNDDFGGGSNSHIVYRASSSGFYYVDAAAHSDSGTGTYAVTFAKIPAGDLNGDGASDLLWQEPGSGATSEWLMSSGGLASNPAMPLTTGYSAVATGDFNGDGITDVLWKSGATGAVVEWLMSANGGLGSSVGLPSAAGWTAVAAADFNGDGIKDVLWQNTSTGATSEWLMSANGGLAGVFSTPAEAGSSVAAIGDFDGNGNVDVMWKNDTTGATSEWLMSSNGGLAGNPVTPSAQGYTAVAAADFNGDGATDILWQNASTGAVSEWIMSGSGGVALNPSTPDVQGYAVVAVGDFNGDGVADIMWQNGSTGALSEWIMSRNGGVAFNPSTPAATGWNVAAAADFNGDGIKDILWKNTTSGATSEWLMSANGGVASNPVTPGAAGWNVVATGDFNGNGTIDIMWQNATTGATSEWLMSPNGGVASNPATPLATGYTPVGTHDFGTLTQHDWLFG
jgi:subtilase family serine protease